MVNTLKKEFEISEEWVSFEIHPETPLEGVSITSIFPEHAIKAMYQRLKVMGGEYGIEFNPNTKLSNSRLALEASEYAKVKGRFHQFHEAVFQAYFTDGKDIGNLEIILDISQAAGLNQEELREVLVGHNYLTKLQETQREAQKHGITGAPTFIINDKTPIVGAQPIQVFRDALAKLLKASS